MEKNLKPKKIELKKLAASETREYSIDSSEEYEMRELINEPGEMKRVIRMNLNKPEVANSIKIRLVVKSETYVTLRIEIFAPRNIENVKSILDMRALLLSENAGVTFEPVLEIDEKNVDIQHKASIGAPDETWINYLNSKGIAIDKAMELLAEGFLES